MFLFPRYTSLVSPSLVRCQANAVEFATKVCWFLLVGGSEVIAELTDIRYDGEIVQRVVTNIATVYYGSYRRGQYYLYTVVDRPFNMLFDLHRFFF